MTCVVCGSQTGNVIFAAREMMFGTRETFDYLECSACGSLQIVKVPRDLGRYYPDSYYSFRDHRISWIRRFLKGVRGRQLIGRTSLLGAILCLLSPPQDLMWLTHIRMSFGTAVLDIGGGSGGTLFDLEAIGFRDLTCVDPYLRKSSQCRNICFVRGDATAVPKRKYGLIMMHHSLEHNRDPAGTLRAIRQFIAEDGILLVRMPIAGTFAWRRYRENWVQLDAPRHLVIFSESAFRQLAERTGFRVERIVYDSNELQFWGSEQYVRDIALTEPQSFKMHARRSPFSLDDMARFRSEAEALNADSDGDQACFFLSPSVIEHQM